MQRLRRPEPVETIDLYRGERALLLGLLDGLGDADWDRPTVCPGWSVRDIALHLLGDDLGLLSRQRDAHGPLAPVPAESLVTFLNRINQEWVQATRRLSARALIDLLGWSGQQTYTYYAGLDPVAPGERVSWAGPEPAPNWLGIAREYTERWVHQQQIRMAVRAPLLDDAPWREPVLATFARALPHTFRTVDAPTGTAVTLALDGDSGTWTIVRAEQPTGVGSCWELFAGRPEPSDSEPAAEVQIGPDLAWRLFTRQIAPERAAERATLIGDQALARHVLTTVAIIA